MFVSSSFTILTIGSNVSLVAREMPLPKESLDPPPPPPASPPPPPLLLLFGVAVVLQLVFSSLVVVGLFKIFAVCFVCDDGVVYRFEFFITISFVSSFACFCSFVGVCCFVFTAACDRSSSLLAAAILGIFTTVFVDRFVLLLVLLLLVVSLMVLMVPMPLVVLFDDVEEGKLVSETCFLR